MRLIMDRAQKFIVLILFFYSLFQKHGHKKVGKWTKNFDVFSKDLIFVPINREYHWTLAVISMKEKCISIYDSLGGNHGRTLKSLLGYLKLEHQTKKNESMDMTGWELKTPKNIPQQKNTTDCGVFVCSFAECLSRDGDFKFAQKDMESLRRRMVLNIAKKEL